MPHKSRSICFWFCEVGGTIRAERIRPASSRSYRCQQRPRGASVQSLRFAFASCQKWDDGYYSAYRRLAEEDLAFVVFAHRVVQDHRLTLFHNAEQNV